jgi:acyl carrier protein
MDTASIYRQLTEIFRDVFDDDSIELTPETTAADIHDWDSANHVNLIVAIEVRMGIKFKTIEVESLHIVGNLVSLVEQKLRAKTGAAQPA